MSEAEIITSVLAGNRDEFRFLIREHQDMIYSMILRIVGNTALAEDLAQETFIKAYNKLSQFRLDSKFSTWLTRIALNTTNSYLGSRKHKNQLLHDDLDLKKHEAKSEIDEKLEKELALKRLRLCIQRLKTPYRETITLCGLEEKSYEEAASILNIPVGTVRSRLNRARKQIQTLYTKV